MTQSTMVSPHEYFACVLLQSVNIRTSVFNIQVQLNRRHVSICNDQKHLFLITAHFFLQILCWITWKKIWIKGIWIWNKGPLSKGILWSPMHMNWCTPDKPDVVHTQTRSIFQFRHIHRNVRVPSSVGTGCLGNTCLGLHMKDTGLRRPLQDNHTQRSSAY